MEENVTMPPVKWKKIRAKRPQLSPFREENDNQKKAVIRNSPRLFSEVLFHLSDDQKKWVEKCGFGALLDFDLEMIPPKLSSKVVQAFDHKSVMIEIEKGNIEITEEDIFYVLRLPHGGKKVEPVTNEETSRRMKEWLSQFPNEQITAARVVKKIREERNVTEMFKINFLVVLSNVLIGTATHSYVDNQSVKFDGLDICVSYNLDAFLIQYLVMAKDSWNNTALTFFRGSQIFLNDYVDLLRDRATNIINSKIQFEKDLLSAMEKYPDNMELRVVKDVVNEIFDKTNVEVARKSGSTSVNEEDKQEEAKNGEEPCNPNAEKMNKK
ncbi:hypothetical protein AgCh_038887 [Apium graveolens]